MISVVLANTDNQHFQSFTCEDVLRIGAFGPFNFWGPVVGPVGNPALVTDFIFEGIKAAHYCQTSLSRPEQFVFIAFCYSSKSQIKPMSTVFLHASSTASLADELNNTSSFQPALSENAVS